MHGNCGQQTQGRYKVCLGLVQGRGGGLGPEQSPTATQNHRKAKLEGSPEITQSNDSLHIRILCILESPRELFEKAASQLHSKLVNLK